MLQVARLAPKLLSESSGLVADFFRTELHDTGGFSNRAGDPDLYYTVFGLEGLRALQADVPLTATLAYLRAFDVPGSLDFVHLTCLARCWSHMPAGSLDPRLRESLLRRLETFRSADGGYHPSPAANQGTAYAAFLACGAYQDLAADMPDPTSLLAAVDTLKTRDGAYTNVAGAGEGATPATAAVVALYRQFDRAAPPVADWLLARCKDGGFHASPSAPMPDLLSTATALHALAGLHAPLDAIKEPCLDFIDSLWTARGAFHGHWADDDVDCEYTYYGLLALGHLSLW